MAQPMARGRLTFRERDVTAAIRAVEKTGHKVARVSIGQDGSIVVELAPPVGSATAPSPEHDPNPWDEVLEDEHSPKL
jgi:hypothetical protein